MTLNPLTGRWQTAFPSGSSWDDLGARCFASTARNAAAGSGNTNPRLAIRQQPAAELTAEGAEWLRQALEQRFEEHGRILKATLRGLDWPVASDVKG